MNRNDDYFDRTRLWIKEAIKKHCPTFLEDTCLFGVALNLVCTVLLAIIFEVVAEYSAVKCKYPQYEMRSLKLPITIIFGFLVLIFILLKCLKYQAYRLGLRCIHLIFFASIVVPIEYLPSYENETTFGIDVEMYKETNIVSPNSIVDIIASMNSTGQAYNRKPLAHGDNCILRYWRTQLNIVKYASILSWVFFVCLFICYHVKDSKQRQRTLPPRRSRRPSEESSTHTVDQPLEEDPLLDSHSDIWSSTEHVVAEAKNFSILPQQGSSPDQVNSNGSEIEQPSSAAVPSLETDRISAAQDISSRCRQLVENIVEKKESLKKTLGELPASFSSTASSILSSSSRQKEDDWSPRLKYPRLDEEGRCIKCLELQVVQAESDSCFCEPDECQTKCISKGYSDCDCAGGKPASSQICPGCNGTNSCTTSQCKEKCESDGYICACGCAKPKA